MDITDPGRKREVAGNLGRMAGRFVKNAGPRARRFLEENRPRAEKALQDARPKVEKAVEEYGPVVEKAGRDAVKYAQDHPDEVRGLVLKGARMRLGPLAMALDALGLTSQPSTPDAPPRGCPKCSKINTAAAKFCSDCGARLPEANGGESDKTA